MDKTIGISELRKSLASIIKDVHEKGSRYIILQHSQAKAVLLSPGDMEILEFNPERKSLRDVKNAVVDKSTKKPTAYEIFFGKK